MKKGCFLTLLSLLLAFSLVFSGCSSKNSVELDSKNPVTIDIWHYYNGAQKTAFDQLITEFNTTVGAEKGIIVEAFNQGDINQLMESVLNSANNKVGTEPIPNIFAAYADTAYQIDQMGLATDLEKYLTEEEIAKYLPSYIDEGRIGADGALKIFPSAKSTEVFMLNKTDWDKFASATGASLDSLATFEGIAATAETYYEWTDSLTPDVPDDGKAFFGRDAVANYLIIGCKQLGVEIFSVKDGKAAFHLEQDVMRRLWDNYYVPFINGYFTANGRFRSDDAKVGDILALIGSTTSATYFPQEVILNDTESYPIETLVLPVPEFTDCTPYAVQQGAGMVVTKSTPKEEYASVEFLKWFTAPERNLKFSILSGYLPVMQEANSVDMLNIALQSETVSDFTPLLRDTLEVAFQTTSSTPLYTNRAFEGGSEARKVLEHSLSDKAAADSEQIHALMAGGMSRAEAIAQFDTDENFAAWLAQLQKDLDATQKG